jgi:hypothetical protein
VLVLSKEAYIQREFSVRLGEFRMVQVRLHYLDISSRVKEERI